MASFTAPPIRVPQGARTAELRFGGVEQAGPSFEARVFLNLPDASETTPATPEAGYAGSFHVYGYGDAPPPAIAEARARSGGTDPVAPIEKRLTVRENDLRRALEHSEELVVTVVVVPVDRGSDPGRPYRSLDAVFDPAR